MIVYPALLRSVSAQWNATFGPDKVHSSDRGSRFPKVRGQRANPVHEHGDVRRSVCSTHSVSSSIFSRIPEQAATGLLKIATFNRQRRQWSRLPVLLRWLVEAKPDVVCLQELKAPQEKFPEAAIREAGYGAIWHGQKSWNGVAILAHGQDPVEKSSVPARRSRLHT